MKLSNIFKKSQKGNALSMSKGFTLIELLVVIGILAVLLAITLIAINPARQFSQANDTKRASDANAILNAINQFMADNKGAPPASITDTATNIGKNEAGTLIDLCSVLAPTYIAVLPSDPLNGDTKGSIPDCAVATYDTKYQVMKSATGRITVSATPEITGTTISVTR